mgnify:CR=1 FL=1
MTTLISIIGALALATIPIAFGWRRTVDEAGMPILHITSRAYDWAYDALSEADRDVMRRMIRLRGEEAYHWLHDQPFEQKAYNSHGGRMWHFLGEAAIAYYGEAPEARRARNQVAAWSSGGVRSAVSPDCVSSSPGVPETSPCSVLRLSFSSFFCFLASSRCLFANA